MYNIKSFSCSDGTDLVYLYSSLVSTSAPEKPRHRRVMTPFLDENGVPEIAYHLGYMEDPETRAAESLRCSLSRTRSRIRDIALSIKGYYFVTFTFSSEYSRYSEDACRKCILEFLNSCRKNNVNFIVVPELHKDGAFHYHGIFDSNLSVSYAGYFRTSPKKHEHVYHVDNWPYGFTTATKIVDHVKSVFYITKYITKELVAVSKGKRRFYYNCHVNNYDYYFEEREDFEHDVVFLKRYGKKIQSYNVLFRGKVSVFRIPHDYFVVLRDAMFSPYTSNS